MRRISLLLAAALLVTSGILATNTGPFAGRSGQAEAAGVDPAHSYEFVTGSFEAKQATGVSFVISNPNPGQNASVVIQLFTVTTQVGGNFTVSVESLSTLTAVMPTSSTGPHFAKLSANLPNVVIQYRYVDAASAAHFVDAGDVRALPGPALGSVFVPVNPFRLCDTRNNANATQCVNNVLSLNETQHIRAAGVGGLPSNIRAVTLNLTVVTPASTGIFRLYPDLTPVPGTAAINFRASQNISNEVTVKVGSNGRIALTDPCCTAHAVLDVTGYFV